MKRTLSIIFAILLAVSITGLAISHELSYQADSGFSQITIPVYNNSNTTLGIGNIVIWDIDASTGDNDAYVNVTTSANTYLVAGIVWPGAINAYDSGSIAIWGMVECDTEAGVLVNSHLCTSATAGLANVCTDNVNNGAYNVGFATAASAAAGQVPCFVDIK